MVALVILGIGCGGEDPACPEGFICTPTSTGTTATDTDVPEPTDVTGSPTPTDVPTTGTPPTGAVPPAETVAATLTGGGIVTCADPSARGSAPWDRKQIVTPANSREWQWGGGFIAGDFDKDGAIDMIAPSEPYANMYRGNGDGTFAVVTDALADFPLTFGVGGSTADYDGDGDLDALILRYSEPNVLLRNDGPGLWVDVSIEAGLNPEGRMSQVAAWSDFDRDGDLDVFVGNYGYVDETGDVSTDEFVPAQRDWLYVNQGDGTFVDAGDALPAEVHDGYTYVARWFDVDGDLWPELYTINDFGPSQPNSLLLNQGGTLVLDAVNRYGLNLPQTGMGVGFGDVTGDGHPEMLIPEWKDLSYLVYNELAGVWVESADLAGIAYKGAQEVGWGAELADVDNDADLDALVVFGHVETTHPDWGTPLLQPDGLWLNNGAGLFTDEAAEFAFDDEGAKRGMMALDLNGDGWLDVAKRDIRGTNVMYVSRCGSEAWLTVGLEQPGMNRMAVGAKVEVAVGDSVQARWIIAGGQTFQSGGPPEVHFGLGGAAVADWVAVTWPDGAVSVLHDVPTSQRATIVR